MKASRMIIVVISFLFATLIVTTHGYMRSEFLTPVAALNSPPVAADDSYTRHGGGAIGPLLANDSDPDGNPMNVSIVTFPVNGHLVGLSGSSYIYALNSQSFTGTDSFTYKACDGSNACSSPATVTVTIVNQAPVAGADSYPVHAGTIIGPMMANDSDGDGDPITWTFVTAPSHGTLTGLANPNPDALKLYSPHHGYTGSDSFTYKVCDQFGLCSAPATVTLTITNNPPVPGPDAYIVRGGTIIGPLFANDFDPEGDSFLGPYLTVAAAHGNVFGLTNDQPGDLKLYVPNPGYSGIDSWQYQITDFLGASGTTTVTLYVIAGDGAENNGKKPCDSVGEPVNVTNGNMYVEQHDFSLSSLGSPIDITRTYNSQSQQIGLFGRGWSTGYDAGLVVYDSNMVRLNEDDGRATYFGRPVGSSGAYAALEGDFHGQLIQSGGGFTLSMADGSSSQFNSAGKLLTITDRNNNSTTLTYNASGFLSSVTDTFGRVLTVTTNANGRVVSLSDTLGTIATYTYGGSSELFSATYADNSAFNFGYDGNFRLTSITDALGNVRESHTYDSQGRALTSEKQGGVERYTLNYVSNTQTDVTDALGRLTKYTIDKTKGRNVVTKVEGVCSCGGGSGSQVQTWSYDSQLNLTSKTDALGRVTSYTYDANGNTLTETDPTGIVTYTYNQFSEVLTRTDQLNGVTTSIYDSQGNRLSTKDALDNTTTFTYDARGQLLTMTDARGKVTTSTYDAVGNLTQQRDPNNITTFYFFDARSRLTKVRDGLSRNTLYAYDAAGRVNKVTHPDLSFVSFTYDLAGRRTTVTDERGNPTNYVYDSAYRLTSQTDAASQTTSYGYDAMSNLTSITDPLSRVANYDYDEFNRPTKITYPPAIPGGTRLFETVAYDAAGNVTQRTDTAGRTTFFAYESANRLDSTTDPENKTTLFDYDALGRVTIVTDALNQQYEFAYDALGRRTQVTRGGVSMSNVYDAVGNRTQRTDYNGTVTNYAYDNLNRLTTITYPTRTATFAYLVTGQLNRATNENGSVYIGYDNRYRVSSFSDPFYYGISYNYDTAGNRTKLKLNGATYATYTYDAVNRLTNLADSSNQNFQHSYDAVNRLTARNAPNGVISNYAYDGLNRLTALTHAVGTNTLIGNQYSYNGASNVTNWTTASGNHAYGYDPVNRLTSATNSAQPNESYAYDGLGNRMASHLSANYNYQSFNKLVSTATATYNYDNNGNLLSKSDSSGTTTFAWDEENRLKQVSLPNGVIVNNKYDGLGRRIQRSTSTGADERYVYDDTEVLLDLNADWSVACTYLNGPGVDHHLRQTSTVNGVLYYLTDHLGSTAGLTDVAGSIVEQVSYDSFGNSGGSVRTRYTYTGRERDPDTGLLYYRARFYDPAVGRFLNEDPIGLSGGLNLYAYVENEPTNNTDPFGLQALPLGRNGQSQRDVDRATLERLMTPRGSRGLRDSIRRLLDQGCIGMCNAYQGTDDIYPEDAPGTFCYLEENLAKSRKCPKCCRNFVFAKQGKWNEAWHGSPPAPAAGTGRFPNNAISNTGGLFNYVVWFPSTRSYAWMDHSTSQGPQTAFIRSSPILTDPRYPNTIWCSTCIPWRGRR